MDQQATEEQYLKLLGKWYHCRQIWLVACINTWLSVPQHYRVIELWGTHCSADVQHRMEADCFRWDHQRLVLSCCPEPETGTGWTECHVPMGLTVPAHCVRWRSVLVLSVCISFPWCSLSLTWWTKLSLAVSHCLVFLFHLWPMGTRKMDKKRKGWKDDFRNR